ncbi:flagellar filament capping protein FliD [Pseudomonas sp. MAP12]|uniref:Flagellar hook-associated protein 2 n=1 Tax=Geopseudomonas aromaticivorans TaxID=2849492 RepID=A0ABS6MTY3_9GAMM|nr:flagellar filament capping protein FliD [Pseudomonas aromaticivorans]MBV2132271.1 flagellar filament capping protein FliD [Pseudomonas aromaticivorans]
MATISSLGVGSGLDLGGLLDQLETAERMKLDPITTQKKTQQTKLSAYGRLKSSLTSLQAAAKTLNDSKTFQGVTSSISGTGVAAAAKSDAVVGRYEVKVNTLAQAQSLASTGVADRTADLGAGTLTITQGSKTLTVDLTAAASSLEDVRDAINKQGGGVSASIVNDGTAAPYRLVLTATATGTDAQMTVNSTGALSGLLGYDSATQSGVMTQTVAAANATLEVNGIPITSQSNVVEGAVQGVTLSLAEKGATHVLTVERDNAAIKSAVSGFVTAYNALQSTISSLTSYNADTQVAGDLLGDATLRSAQGQLRSVLSGTLGEGTLTRLADIGIELELKGTLKLDSDKLDSLVSGNLSALSSFFTGSSTAGGMAGQLGTALDAILKDGGALSNVTKGVESRVKSLNERYTRVEETISATVERYRKQFTQLDMMLSEMNATTSYLTQQFDALNAQLKG